MSKMYLFFIKILFAIFMFNVCSGYGFYKDGTEFVTETEFANISENESLNNLENSLKTLITNSTGIVVVELNQVLLKKVKLFLAQENENEKYLENGKIILATFDSTGLQDVTPFNNYIMLRQAILGLNPTSSDKKTSFPIMQALIKLLQGNTSQSAILLITMTKPSDEDLRDDLIKTLLDKKCQLSVFWAGGESIKDYFLLKTIAERTGGKLIFSGDNNEENLLLRSNFENFRLSDKIKFPEKGTEIEDSEMHLTSRAADQKIVQRAVVPLIVEVASGSNLEIRPGTTSQIQFTVKNNMNIAVPAFFNAKFNGIVQIVQPTQALLPPAGTVKVIVNLQPLGSPQSLSAIGTLTLFAAAANRITARSALISMTPQTITDNTAPKMYYKYNGDCSNYKEPQNCENGQWNLEVTFQDEDSGLLKILSEPYGLLFHSEFIAGSKTPITASYTATCCQPVVQVWGEDLKGNYVKKSFDVYNQNLLAGEIASIVLGVLLLLLIVIVIIAAVLLIRRRNRRNLIIPKAKSGSL